MTIFTLGYEGLDIETFLSLLAEYGVETVVDVRETPLSRKPGFSKKAITRNLNLSGFEYVHHAALGCPKWIRDRYREDGDWVRYTEGFVEHLKSQEIALNEVADLASVSNCALLCYEADFNFCHRSIVANALRARHGADIRHIRTMEVRTARPANYPETAFV
ncbi:MAG: DUF488 domain-containing protein [Candidatus Accumulibacter sp.]|nr:DUF488 domain-containing protein [Accumulibacter sp.]